MYYGREMECENAFRQMGPVFNANTPENHPVIFTDDDDFRSAVSILGFCALQFPRIRIYAFQLMSNHLHLVVGGDRQEITEFFDSYVRRLEMHFGGTVDLGGFTLKLFPIDSLSYLRNAIAYVNRNGFVVHNNVTPFSYPWGSSACFFQPVAARYANLSGKAVGIAELRRLMHTRSCDRLKDVKMVDGFVSPMEFCDVAAAENVFRDAKQYFYLISRNVETYSEIAKSIGESVFYTDNDLTLVARRLAREQFGSTDLFTLDAAGKIEIAKRLHFDYNAGDKQLQRLLKLDAGIVKALF